MKEFGKLSANAMSKPDSGQEQGSMKSIGRQLIDVQAVENIIKAGEKREKIGSGLTTARVISAARGEGIKTLLSKIDTYEGVVGSLIVGHDGLVIASTLQGGIDKDMMGALCSALHSHLDIAAKKLEKGKLQQVVFLGQSPNSPDTKLTVLTAVAVGILAVFVDQCQMERLDGLLQAIETTVKG
ncbi:MAG: roadblock/LC7 domain-containing protein, partial [Candidatus Obscuribacterales bacterium]|nr:roadblock/LC7 domain-containing protein [Candidatus Obscuribacterales bacterium]